MAEFKMGESSSLSVLTNVQLNRDTVPLPPSRRTWGPWSFVGYWITTGVNISGWTGGSALLSLGLTVRTLSPVDMAHGRTSDDISCNWTILGSWLCSHDGTYRSEMARWVPHVE